MNYNYDFDIAALIIMIILILIAFIRKNVPSTKVHIYKRMIVIHFLAIIFDILTISTIVHPQSHNMVYNYLINLGYYLFHSITVILFVMYGTVSEPIVPHRNKVTTIIKVLAFIMFSLILTTPYTKLVFYFDDNLVYSHGPALYFLYTISLLAVAYTAYLKILNRKYHTGFVLVTNVCYAFTLLSAFIINIINGYILIELFVISLGFFIIYLAQDNPESYLYKNINVYNRKAFEDKILSKINAKTKFDVLIFEPSKKGSYVSNLDRNEIFTIERYMIEKCNDELKCDYTLYVLDTLTYAIIIKKDLNNYCEKVKEMFNNSNVVNHKVYNLTPCLGLMNYPDQVTNYDEALATFEETIRRLNNYASNDILIVEKSFVESQDDNEIYDAIKTAITTNNFDIKYQPIFNSKHNISLDAEARIFIKYNDKDLSYEEIFPYATKSGLISELDKSALLYINEFIKKTDVFRFGINSIGVNISSSYLIEKDFYKTLIDFASRNDVLANRICFELSNNDIIADNETFIENLNKLKEYGFHFALDKFGELPISLSSLVKLPFDVIKVDEKLLSIALQTKGKKFVNSIFNVIKSADIHTACGGVDNEKLYNYVLKINCEYYQGSYACDILNEKQYTKFVKDQLRLSLEHLGIK